MSGFLGRLLARSREGMNDVRPRLPGRFEPVRNELGHFAPATEIIERSKNDAMPGPRPDPQTATRPHTPEPPHPQPAHRGKLTQHEPLAPQHTDQRAPASPAVPRPQHNTTSQTARPAGSTARAEEPERTRESHRRPAQSNVRSAHPARTAPTEPRSASTMPRTRAKEANRNAETPTTEPVIAGARRAGVRTERRARPVEPRPAAKDEEQSDDEPVIRIHIGRIDVRAIQEGPPAPAATPARQQPKRLTLEEYARERGRGER
jgi:hypothetical protein